MKPVRNDSIIILVCLIAIAAFLIGKKVGSKEDYTEVVPEDTAAFQSNWGRGERHSASRAHIYYNVEEQKAERFAFDPNTADSTQLLRLGLRPFIVRNIYKYRAKGGRFRKPEDFARMYGLGKEEYKSLEPYIKISSDYQPASSLISETEKSSTPKDSLRYPVKLSVGEHIALNTADTTEFMLLRGVGRFTAMQIIRYRQALGGYYSTSQLYEISEIANDRIDSLLPHLYADTSLITPIDVNRASVKQLYSHPYISYKQAEQLYDLRRRKLRLHSPDELSAVFSPDERQRLLPYLRFDGK